MTEPMTNPKQVSPPDAVEVVNLKPCPFCGGEAERIDIEDGENAGGSCISCTVCQASSNVEFEFKENFVSNWNRREAATLITAQAEEIARLREAVALTESERRATIATAREECARTIAAQSRNEALSLALEEAGKALGPFAEFCQPKHGEAGSSPLDASLRDTRGMEEFLIRSEFGRGLGRIYADDFRLAASTLTRIQALAGDETQQKGDL